MPDDGTYQLVTVGFSSREEPLLLLQQNGNFVTWNPIGQTFSMQFDTTIRFCIGWRDITTGDRFICPDQQPVNTKYEQCTACQRRTGFNPAFYNATSVSPQQEQRNLEAHVLYLAHFGPKVMKVGISHAKRGYGRLLEQGARSAVIIDELPTAYIARQYEAKIAAIPGVSESVQVQKKIDLATKHYDNATARTELLAKKDEIEHTLGLLFDQSEVKTFDAVYFPDELPNFVDTYNCSSQQLISGNYIGLLGSLLFCEQQDTPLVLPLKKYTGYYFKFSKSSIPVVLPPRQSTLF